MKKVVQRMCMGCNTKKNKKELIRIVRTPENEVVIDLTGKKNGHGAYLKKSKEVFDTARTKKLLDKYLECEVDQQIYDELDKLL